MTLVFSLFVPGVPQPQGGLTLKPTGGPITLGAARHRRAAGFLISPKGIWAGKLGHANDALEPWRNRVTKAARDIWVDYDYVEHMAVGWDTRPPLDGPLALSVVFIFERPKSHFTSKGALRNGAPTDHTSKPDLDKLLRAISDALTDAGVWRDDSQVVEYRQVTKRYGKQSGVHIAIYTQQPLEAVE